MYTPLHGLQVILSGEWCPDRPQVSASELDQTGMTSVVGDLALTHDRDLLVQAPASTRNGSIADQISSYRMIRKHGASIPQEHGAEYAPEAFSLPEHLWCAHSVDAIAAETIPSGSLDRNR